MKAFLKKFHVTKRVFSYPYVLFMLLFVVVPLVMIFAYAFMDNDHNFTFENFKIFFTSQSSLYVLGNSLFVGVVTTVICLILGYPVAYILSKSKNAGKVMGAPSPVSNPNTTFPSASVSST